MLLKHLLHSFGIQIKFEYLNITKIDTLLIRGLFTLARRAPCGIAFLGASNRRKKVELTAGGHTEHECNAPQYFSLDCFATRTIASISTLG
jgi:hypothetical protein